MFKLTTKAKRIKQAIGETETILKFLTGLSESLQDKALIETYRSQIVMLQGKLLNEILEA